MKHLEEKRSAKLSKRLSTDTQRLDIAKQELQLKRQAVEKIEEGEKKHLKTSQTFAHSIFKLTKVICKSFPINRE